MRQTRPNLLNMKMIAKVLAVLAATLLIVVMPVPFVLGAETAVKTENSAITPKPVTPTATSAASTEPIFTDSEWQRQQPTTSTPTTGGAAISQAAIGLLVSLVIIAGLAWALAWASKRFGMRRVMPGRGQHLQVIETVPLGFKRAICLVRIHDQVIVVGQGEHELCHLATFSASVLAPVGGVPAAATYAVTTEKVDAQETKIEMEKAPQPPQPSSAFRQLLESLGGRRS